MTAAPRTVPAPRSRGPIVGGVLLVLCVAYAVLVFQGLGAAGSGPLRHWWQPHGFFFTWAAFDTLLSKPLLATLVFTVPALALFVAVAATARSALGTTIALAALGLVVLFCFYGLGGNRRAVWGFFGWRGSGAMVLFALAVAAAVLSPLLTRRWLERGWPGRITLYAPIFFAVLASIRDVTGTDPTLPFAISPWPVVPMFGLEVGAAAAAALLALFGLVLAAAGSFVERRAVAGILCALLGLAIPLAVFALRLGVGTGLLALLVGAALVERALSRGERAARSALLTTGGLFTLGAALVALPILAGQLLVDHDYDVTRNVRAQHILDALDHYYARESMYPDKLEDLVKSKDLDAVPTPEIGFGVLETPHFTYQSFGTNYLLEFSAPRWVECAYNPPYPDEEGSGSFGRVGGSEGAGEKPAEEKPRAEGSSPAAGSEAPGEPGSWSCPQKPPELW